MTLKPLVFRPDHLLRVIGVHDPFSALVANRGGFDALWISSFGVSAACFGMPDAGLLTESEMLDTVRRIRAVGELPMIVDADTGYGGILNIRRLVQGAESAQAQSICVEDAEFPKRNSFLNDGHQRLASVRTMCERIQSAVEARRDQASLLIIARTEALVQGHSLNEALDRAAAYVAAGADAIVAHSTQRSGIEAREFARQWASYRPLVAIPTAYPHVPLRDLHAAGFSAAVLANQLLRGAFRAMVAVRETLAEAKAPAGADSLLSSMAEIHSLVEVSEALAFESAVEHHVDDLRPDPVAPVAAMPFLNKVAAI